MATKKKPKTYPRPFRESGGDPYVGGGVTTQDLGNALGNLPTPPPNIDQILANDPIYIATMGNLNAYGIQDKASRDDAIRRAYIDYGGAPLPPDFQSVIDPTAQSLADKNTAAGLSVLARIKDQTDIARRRGINNLGSRGMFHSGETGYTLGRVQLANDQAQYDSRAKLMDYIYGVQAAWMQSERQRLADLEAARNKSITDAPPGAGYVPDYGGVGQINPIPNYNGQPITPPPIDYGQLLGGSTPTPAKRKRKPIGGLVGRDQYGV